LGSKSQLTINPFTNISSSSGRYPLYLVLCPVFDDDRITESFYPADKAMLSLFATGVDSVDI
jgi:hypothetical protein